MAESDSTSISNLSIQITAETESASRKISRLSTSIKKLVSASSGLGTVANHMDRVEKAVNNINSGNVNNMKEFASAMARLSKRGEGLDAVAQGIKHIGDSCRAMDNHSMQNFRKMSASLSDMKMPSMGNFAKAFEKLDKIDWDKVKEGLNSCVPAIEKISSAASSDGLKDFVANLAAVARSQNKVNDLVKQASNTSGNNSPPLENTTEAATESVEELEDAESDSSEGADQLNGALKAVSSGGSVAVYAINDVVDVLGRLKREMVQTIPTSTTFGGAMKNIFSGLTQEAKATVDVFSNIFKAGFYGFMGSDDHALESIQNVEEAMKQLVVSIAKVKMAMMTFTGVSVLKALYAPLRTIINGFETLAGVIGRTVSEKAKEAFREIPELIKKCLEPMDLLKEAMSGFGKVISKISGPFGKVFSSLLSSIEGLKARFTRVIVTKLIRGLMSNISSAITDGFKDLYYYGGRFATTMDAVSTEILYLKNSIAAMLAPAIEALYPIMEKVVDGFVDIMNVINMTIAALTGASTWTKAVKSATTYQDALGETNDTANELKKTLLGFDEMNVLDSATSGSGSGSDTTIPDYSSMFTTQEVALEGWGKKIKDVFDDIVQAAKDGDWEGVGKTIGDGLNGVVKKIDDWILEAQKTLPTWAEDFADICNGLVGTVKWADIGKTVGDGVNLISKTMNSWYTSFNAAAAGSGVGDAIMGLFGSVKWSSIGSSLSGSLNEGIEFAAGLASSLKWAEIGTAIAQAFDGFLNGDEENGSGIKLEEASKTLGSLIRGAIEACAVFITSISWKDVGTKIVNTLKAFFSGLSGEGPTDSFSLASIPPIIAGLITDMLSTVGSCITSINWSTVGSKIGTTFNSFLGAKNANGSYTLFTTAASVLGTVLKSTIEASASFIGAIDWSGIGTTIATSLKTWLEDDPFSSVVSLTKAVGDAIVSLLTGFSANFTSKDWIDLGTKLGTAISDMLTSIPWADLGKSINGIATGLLTAIYNAFTAVPAKDVAKAIDDLFTNIDWSGIQASSFTILFDAIWDILVAYVELKISQLWDTIKEFVDNLFNGNESKSISEGISSVTNAVSESVKEVSSATSGASNNGFVTFIENIATALKDIYDKLTPIEDTLSNINTLWEKIFGSDDAEGELTVNLNPSPTGGGLFEKIKGAFTSTIDVLFGGKTNDTGSKTDAKTGLFDAIKSKFTNNSITALFTTTSGESLWTTISNYFDKDNSSGGRLTAYFKTLSSNHLWTTISDYFDKDNDGRIWAYFKTGSATKLWTDIKNWFSKDETASGKGRIWAYFKTSSAYDLWDTIRDYFATNDDSYKINTQFGSSDGYLSKLWWRVQNYFATSDDTYKINTQFGSSDGYLSKLWRRVQNYFSTDDDSYKIGAYFKPQSLGTVLENIKTEFAKTTNKVSLYFQKLTSNLKDIWDAIVDYFSSFLTLHFTWNSDGKSSLESVVSEAAKSTAQTNMSSYITYSSTPIVVNTTVTLDGKVVGNSVVEYINGQAVTTGKNPLSAYI